ncbi:uncharacterized protein [Dermacentor albipictus]|uniref:uncharacterized protein isoform X2 n=1 Tax=Dermacentor albipictus TaxID=60249 RepID=UPI0031FCCC58
MAAGGASRTRFFSSHPFHLDRNLGSGVYEKMDMHIKNAFIKALSHFETPIDSVPEGYCSFLEYYFDRRHLADKFLRKSQGCHPRVKNGDSRKEQTKNGGKENDATAGGNCPMEVLQHPSGGLRHFKFRPQQNIQNLDPENMDSEMLKPLNPQRPNPSQLGPMLHQRQQAAQGARSRQARNKWHSSRHQQQQGAQAEGHPGLAPNVPYEGTAPPGITQTQFQRVPQNMGTAGLQMGAAPSSFVPPPRFVVAPPFRPPGSLGANSQTAPHPDVQACMLGLHLQQPAQQLSEDMGHQRYGQRKIEAATKRRARGRARGVRSRRAAAPSSWAERGEGSCQARRPWQGAEDRGAERERPRAPAASALDSG